MLNKARRYSESYSRSISEVSESLTPFDSVGLSEETKDEMKTFFEMLELPLSEIGTDHILAFTSCVNYLISRRILPISEQIKLEEFGSSLSENLTIAAYCQKEMKEKQETINQITSVSKRLDNMGNNICQLKNDLQQLDKEETELLTHLSQLRELRKSLLAQKELINHELANVSHDEQGIKTIIQCYKHSMELLLQIVYGIEI